MPDENWAGMCMWCSHDYQKSAIEPQEVYSWGEDAQDIHFANWCPCACDDLKERARKRLDEKQKAPTRF